MGLSQISEEDLCSEKKIIDELFIQSDRFCSVVFNSGAGSGKTYALIECLKYIISHRRECLKSHNQKIACITYTNVAAEHIKQQLGVSDVAEVSTIHERVWNIIHNQKTALLNLHIAKLKNEIELIDDQLLIKPDYEKYRKLDTLSQDDFFQLMYESRKKYNASYNLSAAEFRAAMPEKLCAHYAELITNVTKFKGLVDKLFKRKRFIDCLQNIENREKGYNQCIIVID